MYPSPGWSSGNLADYYSAKLVSSILDIIRILTLASVAESVRT